MRRWSTVTFVLFTLLAIGPLSATAQTALVPGGLTALPAVRLGPTQLTNGGFDTLSGSLPAGWSGGSGWGADQLVKRSGGFSYRRTTGAATSTQSIQVKKGVYTFSAWIKTENLGSASAGVRLQADLRPGLNFWYKTGVISGTRDWTLYELKNIAIEEDRRVVLKLENYGNPSGTAWFDDVKFEEQLPEPVNAYLLYPNYRGMLFDDKPQTMKIDVSVTPPGDDFARYQVRATLTDEGAGSVIATQTYAASAHFVANLNGGGMQAGRPYLLRVALIDRSSGSPVYTYPAYRVSRVPASQRASMNTAFDEKNRLLVHGTPRFALGVYDAGMGYGSSDAFWENALWSPTGERRMNGMKINFYLNYWYGEASVEAITSLAGNLGKHGVNYLQTGNCFSGSAAGRQFLINSTDSYVREIGAHPAMAGYYVADECDSVLVPGVFAQYQRLKQQDPDGMTFSALFGNADISMWRDASDVLSSDPYPMYAAEPAAGYNHGTVAEWTATTREAVKDSRPIMTVLQFFKFTSRGRWPTRPEMRNHAYMAIVEGARGLWWWSLGTNALKDVCSGWCDQKTHYMNDLKAVVNEIADLEPALLADDAPGVLRSTSNGAIKTKVKLVNGRGYLFAYNSTNSNQTASFTWNTAPGTVTVNAEGRSLRASGSSFSDSFGPYQAHVYLIGTGGTDGGTPTSPPPSPPPAPTALFVTFTNPVNDGAVSGSRTVSMNAGGGSGYSYRVTVDGTEVYTGTNNTFTWNTGSVADGQRQLRATVTDADKRTATASISVTVANGTTTPPPPRPGTGLNVGINSPSANAAVAGAATVRAWVGGASGTRRYTLLVDNVVVASTSSSLSTVTFRWDTRKVANGARRLSVAVTDAAGKGGQATVGVTVSNNGTSPAPAPAPSPSPAPTPPRPRAASR